MMIKWYIEKKLLHQGGTPSEIDFLGGLFEGITP